MPTMRTLLARIWNEQVQAGACDGPSWHQPLEPGHVQRTIMLGVAYHPGTTLADLERALSPGGEPEGEPTDAPAVAGLEGLPGLRGHATETETPVKEACAHLRGAGREVVVRLTSIARQLADETSVDLPANQHREVALWAAGVVGRWYRRHRSLPPAAYLASQRDAEIQRRANMDKRHALRLDDDELDATHWRRYDDLWDADGAASLRECSPVALGLGRYQRPPWRGGAESNWRCGTDRAVLDRYGDYFSEKGWARDPDGRAEREGLDTRQHVRTRILDMDPETIVDTELRRACAPLGLRCPEHRVLVTAVVRGIDEADLHAAYERRHSPAGHRLPDHRPTLTRWRKAGRGLPAVEDPDLVAGVARYAEQWVEGNDTAKILIDGLARHARPDPGERDVEFRGSHRRSRVRDLDDVVKPDRPAPADDAAHLDWHIQVQLGPPRRLWGHVHGREVEWEEPLSRHEAVGLIWSVLQNSMLDLRRRPLEDPRDAPPETVDYQDRLAATLARLHTHERADELMALLRAGDPRWRAVCLDILTGGGPFGPEHARLYLSPAELLSHFGFDDPEGP